MERPYYDLLVCTWSSTLNGIVKMAYIFKVAQKVKTGLRGISTCVIRGKYEDITFPQHMFEPIVEYATRCPLVSKVPTGRLFHVASDKPNQMEEHWRRLFFSGLVHSVNCKANSDCIYKAFDLDNVGVLRDLNVLAFRRFERMDGLKNTNHEEFCLFVENLFSQLYGPDALYGPEAPGQLDELKKYLSLFQEEHPPDDDFLLHNPFFLGEMDIAHFYVDAHRLIRHEFPVRRQGHSSDRILSDMESCYGNFKCIDVCEKNALLTHLLGAHAAKPRATSVKLCKWPPCGSAVVDVHRHAATHCIEWSTLDKARASPLSFGISDLLNRYTWQEVIRGMRYEFPHYPQAVARSFENNKLWYTLSMHRRLPVPSIYGYVAPRVSK
ncbi:hypothetical protein BDA96_10G340800 [Sorghum bicolor]|uniref:Uncharacterized protein n=1 Tax=Sorghum bicolor TaxID=4558 RepID=A0A921U339_SORBI|nr:uncharacterized protein LOC110431213 isoform X2 [Sorghum bicolor]XP_021305636.1 uncharacterized protein LOC110431213 isoform X2 [Sorghum bicolor]XP_021305637.1 uncharacterized protein LOC110431213 isoform X2 [Sorghum bicolor]KAG0516190.1 hypothetical protein BDA96_10G340800 [Sorghum bicolor]KAG0516191.1 hypothetical protein BDA96_10G340800 [Sorghum bicolor]|eukprot:XP_021305635.1 uncharacterized protein LOC110431213 isoform X2 [Sorghum bicolor]